MENTLWMKLDTEQLDRLMRQMEHLTAALNRVADIMERLDTRLTDIQVAGAIWPEHIGDTKMSFVSELVAGLRLAMGLLPPDDPYLTPKSAPSATRVDAKASRADWVDKVLGALDTTQDDEPSWHPSGYTDRLSHTSQCLARWQNDSSFNHSYDERFPHHCDVCDGWGRRASYNLKLSHVISKVYDTRVCPACVSQSLCPRCKAQFAEPYHGDHEFMALRCGACGWEPSLGGLRCVHCTCGAEMEREVGR
jgi:hypothetical protein